MLSSKDRAALRGQANTTEVILHVGKGGVTEAVIEQTRQALAARELVKGKVLESAGMTAREVCDALCQATGADGVQCIGAIFVLYKKAPEQVKAKLKKNPVREGVRARREAKRSERERRNQYFHEQAVQKAIERRIARENRGG